MTEPGWHPEHVVRTLRDGLLQYLPSVGSATEGSAIALMALMQGISEQSFAAGWANNLEYELWQCAHGEPPWNDRLEEEARITPRQCALLRLLSDECRGWWMYPTDDDEAPLRFVSIQEWEQHIARYWVHRGGFVSRR